MIHLSVCAGLVLALLDPGSALATPPPAEKELDKRSKVVRPEDASEGARDLKSSVVPLKKFVEAQPYGKTWRELVPTAPPPKDKSGLAGAESHQALSNDPIEIQEQSQFLRETGVEARYGFVSIRGVQVYRYGRLVGAQLVIERIGREKDKWGQFQNDLLAVMNSWTDVAAAFGLGAQFSVVRNDLEKAARSKDKPISLPLRIEFEPKRNRP